jgi:hypothetical protein
MVRMGFRLILVGSALLALVATVISIRQLGIENPSAWATVAAALAVIAAVASAWTSQRILELQEDEQEPNPVPLIDLRSRYQLAQFRITNTGGSSTHQVRVEWKQQLRNSKGEDVLLGRDVAIPVIPEGESASILLGASYAFMDAHTDTTFRGTLSFENASGRRYRKPFVVSAEHERVSLVHDEELPKLLVTSRNFPMSWSGWRESYPALPRLWSKSLGHLRRTRPLHGTADFVTRP